MSVSFTQDQLILLHDVLALGFSGEPFLPDNHTAYMAKEFHEKILKL